MQCHYCDREAAYAAESDAVRVGLCEEHFRERVEELAESEGLERVRDEVDVRHERRPRRRRSSVACSLSPLVCSVFAVAARL